MMNKIDIPDRGKKKRVVIVGGGFGGLKLARKLKNDQFQVVLLDKNNYHLFQPLLYQVATAGIEPSAISFPFRKIFKKRKYFHIRICEARRVIPEQKLLETSIGAIDYDYLVIATGCYTNYFGNNKMAEKTMSLKTTAEALYNRNQVLESFEKAQNTTDPKEREKLMTFIIVGGGATGIELHSSAGLSRLGYEEDADCAYRCRLSPAFCLFGEVFRRGTGLFAKERCRGKSRFQSSGLRK